MNIVRLNIKAFRLLGMLVVFLCYGYLANAQSEEEEVFVKVEDQPSFPGGEFEMIMFISQKITYSKEMLELDLRGTVYIQFIVEKDGSITHIKVIRGVHESLDNEMIRVIKLMPKWIPGKQQGMVVRTQFTLPVRFT